jgi:ribosomal protein L25 (general stress protein Ctc)
MTRFGETFQRLVRQTMQTEGAIERLRFSAKIPRQIYAAEQGLLQGAGVVAPSWRALSIKENARAMSRKPG